MRLLSTTRLEPAWSIGDAMDGNSVKQLLMKSPAERSVALALDDDHQLEIRQRLDGAFEADRSEFNAVLGCSLSHDRADEIADQDVRPDILPYELEGLAPQQSICETLDQWAYANSV